jgi:hypothetical protein
VAWDPNLIDGQILAIHAALLPTNEILMFGGDEHSQAQHDANSIDHTRLFGIGTSSITTVPSPTTDVFCSGHAFLGDGRLLIAGGTETWSGEAGEHEHGVLGHFTGHRASWAFRARARAWTRVSDMRPEPGHEVTNTGGGRWYPTLVALADGQVLAIQGHPSQSDTRHANDTPERYLAGSNSWFLLTAQASNCPFYPRVHLLPSGEIFFCTPVNGASRRYEPVTGTFGAAITSPADGIYTGGWDATSVLLPLLPGDNYTPRILFCGGVQPIRINLGDASPSWQNTTARTGAAAGRERHHLCAVLLPTGQVFLSGGVTVASPEAGVREAELYTPGIDWAAGSYTGAEAWASLESAQVTRNYHSVALLMPNGRVWTAGSSKNAAQGDPATVGEKRIEIYRPAYDADPNRPQITQAPRDVAYGEAFDVRTPQAASIQRVALIKCSSVTHAFVADQRYVALVFTQPGTDRLRVTAPPHGGVAPPGNYMLWIIDNAGRPCTVASIVRVGAQRCFIVTDRSTFSIHEVNALLSGGGTATFPRALYVVMDGFLPEELGSPITAPVLTFTYDSPAGSAVPGMSAALREVLFEDPLQPPDLPQRATFVFDVRFSDATGFDSFPEARDVNVRAAKGIHIADATLSLIHQPNPYMIDGPVSWLSVDVRAFQIRPGMTRAGIIHGSGPAAPNQFLQQLLGSFNTTATDEFHPFFEISTDQQASQLELSREVNGQRVYNYAIAKVRYRAAAVPATDVKVFFRTFSPVGTALEYMPSTSYRRAGSGAAAIPLLGLLGGEIASIPYFAEPRVDTAAVSMTTQTDPLNRRTLNPAGAQESVGYFGCWLDFNQTEQRFPLHPTDDGPYAGRLSIQQLIRGHHQCLVAEVYFGPDPIPIGATPGSSENLSQRNLAIVQSINPGDPASRTVQHTFVVKPSLAPPRFNATFIASEAERALSARYHYLGPDELIVRWGNLPTGTQATVYLPDVDVDEVIDMAGARSGSPLLERVDPHTIRCLIGDVTYIPLPSGRAMNIPGLITLELPEGVVKGDLYEVFVHQYSGVTGRIVGAFQITIPVSAAELVLPAEIRKLSVLRHVADAIPAIDHWRPVFDRYLGQIGDRVGALGGDPDEVEASPDGTGKREPGDECDCRPGWLVAATLAAIVAVVGTARTAVAAPIAAAGIVVALAILCYWIARCRPRVCDVLPLLLLGLGSGGAILGVVELLDDRRHPRLLHTLAVDTILLAIVVVLMLLAGCGGACWRIVRRRPLPRGARGRRGGAPE